MKKVLWILLFLFLVNLIPLGVIFVKPLLVINPHLLSWGLHKTEIFKSWSWKQARFSHERKSLLHRNFEGEFRDFCFDYDRPSLKYETCFEKITWNLDFKFSWSEGFFSESINPLEVISTFTNIVPGKTSEEKAPTGPPDLFSYWQMLWHPLIPDMLLDFRNITMNELKLFVKAQRDKEHLQADVPYFHLDANKIGFTITSTEEIPVSTFALTNLKLEGEVRKTAIPLELTGDLSSIEFLVDSLISLPLKGDFTSVEFLKDTILRTTGIVTVPEVERTITRLSKPPYNKLPAPFNVMKGMIRSQFHAKDAGENAVNIFADTGIKLKSKDQVVDIDIGGEVPFDLVTKTPGLIHVGVDFNQFKLNLPPFSKKSLPPQLKPDGRFKTKEEIKAEAQPKPVRPILVQLTADNKKSMNIETNFIKEIIKLNFDLSVSEEGVRDGFVKLLPLKTEILRRKIDIDDLVVKFKAPLSPVLEARIKFPLPDYVVTMDIEGPIDQPRYAFSSEPPLPEDDILAVLIYGRPLDDLDESEKSSTSTSSQILSQGLFSLTSLYLLSGTPIEYIGYDQEKKSAFAQIGLGSKSSLRLGGSGEGVNSTELRRSLGKGWFIDTSVQDTNTGVRNDESQSFGVMLERIISY